MIVDKNASTINESVFMAPWSQSVAQPPPTSGKKEKKNVMLAPQHGQPPLLPPHQKQSTLACGSHAPSGGTLKQSIINMYGQKYGSRLQQQKELQPSQGSDLASRLLQDFQVKASQNFSYVMSGALSGVLPCSAQDTQHRGSEDLIEDTTQEHIKHELKMVLKDVQNVLGRVESKIEEHADVKEMLATFAAMLTKLQTDGNQIASSVTTILEEIKKVAQNNGEVGHAVKHGHPVTSPSSVALCIQDDNRNNNSHGATPEDVCNSTITDSPYIHVDRKGNAKEPEETKEHIRGAVGRKVDCSRLVAKRVQRFRSARNSQGEAHRGWRISGDSPVNETIAKKRKSFMAYQQHRIPSCESRTRA